MDGARTEVFPQGGALARAKPVYENFPGFRRDISGCRSKEELPKAALDYIAFIERAVACKIKYVSVGASRDAYVEM